MMFILLMFMTVYEVYEHEFTHNFHDIFLPNHTKATSLNLYQVDLCTKSLPQWLERLLDSHPVAIECWRGIALQWRPAQDQSSPNLAAWGNLGLRWEGHGRTRFHRKHQDRSESSSSKPTLQVHQDASSNLSRYWSWILALSLIGPA